MVLLPGRGMDGVDPAFQQRRHEVEPYTASGHDLYRRGVGPSQFHQPGQHLQAGCTVGSASAGQHPVNTCVFEPGKGISGIYARGQGSVKRPVERHLRGGTVLAGHPGNPAQGCHVWAAVGCQYAHYDAGSSGTQGRNDVVLEHLKLLAGVREVSRAGADQYVDRQVRLACLLNGSDAWRDAIRFGQGRAEFHPCGAHGCCETYAAGIFHGQFELRQRGGGGPLGTLPHALPARHALILRHA